MVEINTWRFRIAGQGLGPGKGIQLGCPLSFRFVQKSSSQAPGIIKMTIVAEAPNDSSDWQSTLLLPEKNRTAIKETMANLRLAVEESRGMLSVLPGTFYLQEEGAVEHPQAKLVVRPAPRAQRRI